MSIALLRQWLGPAAPSPHDTELRRLVRDALIEHDALLASTRAALRDVLPYAESRVEDIIEEVEAIRSGAKQVEEPMEAVCAASVTAQMCVESAWEAMGYQRCIECGEYLLPDEREERPYVALPGDVVAYSTHCRDGCASRNTPLAASDIDEQRDETCGQCGLVDECRCHGVQSSDDLDAEGEAP